MINFFKIYLKNKARNIPQPLKNFLKRICFDKLYEAFLGKYADELSFQFSWANAYNGKSEELKKVLTALWKEYRCLDEILRICNFDKEKKVLDVGCGIATVLHILEGRKYGIDPLGNEYKKIYKYPEDLAITHGHAEKIPYPSGMFDVVLCSNALDHVTNPKMALSEIRRVLVEGGFFVLVVEIRDKELKRDIKHPHTFTMEKIRELICSEEFLIVFEKVMPWHGGVNSNGYVAIMQKVEK